ncbi:MAG: superoxide dismutase [Bacteroidetes bacterium HGW-Bacteroidetes-2]|jgi:Cu-Zn family superoxide dismutase|nr:MAG: superoxide dismutase [Bacteroidetes bacterium HGW-Bacteroidetes-8]PKP26673.1 MAG: superoxide dismutase [Bacteroidetes bacterium HGW-Bacteroidetes-2]
MKNSFILLLMIIAFSITSCKDNKKQEPKEEDTTQKEMVAAEKTEIKVVMEPKSETNTKGLITFTQEEGVVKMIGSFSGLQEGTHAIHLHEKADCTAADGTSSGGHWNPTFEQHGKWGDTSGYHKGDIGNFNADAQGNGEVAFKTNEWCIGCGDEKKDILGKAIIVHAGTDDFVTQPTGNAGGRISCGGIIQ